MSQFCVDIKIINVNGYNLEALASNFHPLLISKSLSKLVKRLQRMSQFFIKQQLITISVAFASLFSFTLMGNFLSIFVTK